MIVGCAELRCLHGLGWVAGRSVLGQPCGIGWAGPVSASRLRCAEFEWSHLLGWGLIVGWAGMVGCPGLGSWAGLFSCAGPVCPRGLGRALGLLLDQLVAGLVFWVGQTGSHSVKETSIQPAMHATCQAGS